MTFLQQCAVYWPSKDVPKQQYGPFKVELVDTSFCETYRVTVRDLKLTKSGQVSGNKRGKTYPMSAY